MRMNESILVYAPKALFSNTNQRKKDYKNHIIENDFVSSIAIS